MALTRKAGPLADEAVNVNHLQHDLGFKSWQLAVRCLPAASWER